MRLTIDLTPYLVKFSTYWDKDDGKLYFRPRNLPDWVSLEVLEIDGESQQKKRGGRPKKNDTS